MKHLLKAITYPVFAFLLLFSTLQCPIQAGAVPVASASEKTEVLDPEQYEGQVKEGYRAAKKIPEICKQLFCYCGCDLTDCHGSLLDCFTNDHGVDCHICQEEAIIALKLHEKGKSMAYIQKKIDKKYAKEYPFELESDVLRKYKAERLWGSKKNKVSTKDETSEKKADFTVINTRRTKDNGCCQGDKNKEKAKDQPVEKESRKDDSAKR